MISRAFAEVGGRWSIRLALAAAMAAVLFPFTARAQTTGRQLLHGHVPPAIARLHLQPKGLLPATNNLHLAIGLPLRNQDALTRLLAEIYDPSSTNYHHYLTPEQFAAQFGPSEQDYQSLINFAQTNGLKVTATYPNRTLLDVSGSAATVEKVFHVRLNVYQHPTENRTFYAPDTEPSIDFSIPILHVSGLDNYSLPRPASLKKNSLNNRPASGTGPSGSYMGKDFRTAYTPGVTLNGTGQQVGLLEFDGFLSNDITAYETLAGIPPVSIRTNLLDSFDGTPSSDDTEVCLDIEMAISMATNLAAVVVFEAGPSGSFDSILESMVSSNQIKQFSSSWGSSGESTDPNADQIFTNMAVQGQSFFQASGDGDAWVNTIWVPAASPYVTSVGGTTLTMNGSGASYASEAVWNTGYNPPAWSANGNGYWGSGGGVSANYPISRWQQGINMVTNQGSTTQRNIPDVALTASGIFAVANNGQQDTGVIGTSCAAPLWAGFTALVNQLAVAGGRPAVGFLNPAIYAIGKSPNYTADFHDITNGNNFSAVSPTNYPAVPGYDLCTGWGTPNGINLITALATPDGLGILPGAGFTASGTNGGPFNVTSMSFSLTNSGGASLNWSVIGIPSWLKVSPTSGTLVSGGTTGVTASLNSVASNLLAGIYSTNIVFTNLTSCIAQFRQFTLQIGQPLLQNGGFETGDFTGWALNGDGGNINFVANSSSGIGISPHSGTYFAAFGEPNVLAYLSQNIATFTGQSYLLSFWMDSPNGLTPNEFNVSWNGNVLADFLNMPQLGWTNLQFIVTATGTSTVLQFGGRDDPAWLGLDDVSLTPIPVAAFQPTMVAKTNNNLKFTWNALTGLVYQVQFKTNLLQTNWLVLKSITATNTPITFVDTNPITGSRQKFYRLLLLP